jgi:hypothetical protein
MGDSLYRTHGLHFSPLFGGGGVDAVERKYGHGGMVSFRHPTLGRRVDGGAVPGVRHLAQDRAQDLHAVQGVRARSLARPVAPAAAQCQAAADAGGGADRRAEAGEAALGGAQAPRAAGEAARGRRAGAGALDHPRRARPPRPGRAPMPTAAARHRHGLVAAGGAERSVVHRLQGRVPPRQPPLVLSAHRHRPARALSTDVRGAGVGEGNSCLYGVLSPVRGTRPAHGDPLRQRRTLRQPRALRPLAALGLVAPARHPHRAHQAGAPARDTARTSACI